MRRKLWLAVMVAGLMAAGMGGRAWAQNTGEIRVTASPGDAAVKVWIDNQPTAGSMTVSEGVHSVRVKKEGGPAIERQVLVKPNVRLEVIADFERQSISVKNEKDLGYNPYQGDTKIVLSPPGKEPPPPPSTTAPETTPPPSAPETEKKEAGAEAAPSKPSGYRPCAPGEWCPEPGANEIGPAKPPKSPETQPPPPPGGKEQSAKAETPPSAAKKPEAKKEPEKREADKSTEKKEAKPAVPPCSIKPHAVSCAAFGNTSDIKSLLYSYYCALTNHDLESAFRMWSIDKDLAWFYESSANFCQVEDFRLRHLTSVSTSPTQAQVNYTVEFLDAEGRLIESRKMTATLVKRGDSWALRTNVREQSQPPSSVPPSPR